MTIIRIVYWLGLFIQPYLFCMNLEWGVAACRGWRETMEDRHTAIINDNSKQAFFAIYDGHGGHQVAEYLQQEFYHFFLSIIQKSPVVEDALKTAFVQYDARLRQKTDIGQAGSTAVVVYLVDNKAYIAWAGDSRAVIVRGNKIVYQTRDHKPIKEDNPSEYERCKENVWRSRLYGQLAVSRAFGDFTPVRSTAKHDDPDEQRYKSYPLSQALDALIVEPEVIVCDLQLGDIIVMACDGLWDKIPNEKLEEHLVKLSQQSDQQLDTMFDAQRHRKVLDSIHIDEHPCSNDGNNATMRLWAQALRTFGLISTDNVTVSCIRIKAFEDKPMDMSSNSQSISNFLTRSNATFAIAISVALAGCYYLARTYSSDEIDSGDRDEDGDSVELH